MRKSLKAEQIRLLKLEKQLLGAGVVLAGLTGASGARAEETLGDTFNAHAGKVTEAYLNLVQTLQAAHDALNEKALAAGVQLLEARGTPKEPPLEAAKSILGLG